MSPVGPQLPPSLMEKRKRADDESDSSAHSSASNSPEGKSSTPDTASKRRRVIGPSLPPAALDERPPSSPSKSEHAAESSSDDDDDDDDFGPSLPSAAIVNAKPSTMLAQTSNAPGEPITLKRDEWMTVAPSHGDWSARVDPTKLKNRKFQTGKGAKGPSRAVGGGASDTWHETPEQKQARLQREIMGIRDDRPGQGSNGRPTDDKQDAATKRRMQEYNKSRGPTLYEAHQKGNPQEREDDPSARAFDREKDIAGGLQINSTQRREMMKKAGDFGSRFSSARYL